MKTEGVYADVSDDEYHADRLTLSSSGAKLLLPPSCPAAFKERMDNPPKPKPEYTFGHAAHRLVLGKGAEIIEVDAPDWRSKAAREIREQACNGIAPMLTHELTKARAMAAAVHTHSIAGPLFTNGEAEQSLYAEDPDTGITLRARPDWMTKRDGRLWIVDLKTSITAEPFTFARKAADYKYHFQAAFYRHVANLLGLDPDPAFVLVVVEKEAPHLVSVVEFDETALDEGDTLVAKSLRIYRECSETNTWPGYDERIHSISLPLWAFSEEEMEF